MSAVWLTRPLPQAVLEAFPAGYAVEMRAENTTLSAEELRRALTDFDAVIPTLGDAFSAEVFADVPQPRARVLANFGVGYNHLDVAAARGAGVTVTNTPGAVTDATADIAITLMLMSARRAGEGERMVRAGAWPGWHPTQLLGLHVTGKRVGIVGMGRIGQAIAQRCRLGFGMEVRFYNRSAKVVEGATQVDSLEGLARQVDVLVVAVPGGAETRHLVDAKVLAAMQRHAHLINISRGDVVDEAALIAALDARQIGGAGLDVYEHEPQVPDALRAFENAVLLPHLGTAAEEVRIAMGRMAVDNVVAVLEGRAPSNPV
ncbi:MAG: D-glycerate dehydrogenase [Pseudomonadota bacterium]